MKELFVNWPWIWEELAERFGFENCRKYGPEGRPDVWLIYAPGHQRAKRIRVFGDKRWEWA